MKWLVRIIAMVLVFVPYTLSVAAQQALAPVEPKVPDAETVLAVFKDRTKVPDNIQLSIAPVRESAIKGFFETSITTKFIQNHPVSGPCKGMAMENKQEMQGSVNVLITNDGRYAAFDDIVALGPNINGTIDRHMREEFRFSESSIVKVSEPRPSPFPGFNEVDVAMTDGTRRQLQSFYLTADNRFLIVGIILPLAAQSEADMAKTIDLVDQPFQGRSDAKVTLVVYGDLDCPKSAALQVLTEDYLLPKYGDRIRIVFKQLPWTPIWSWTWQGSLASECAYQLEPSKFAAYRSLIFANQNNLNSANVEPFLLKLADNAGLSADKMASCIDSEQSRDRVERDVREARILGIATTPTIVINGTMLMGAQTKQGLDQAIEAALSAVK